MQGQKTTSYIGEFAKRDTSITKTKLPFVNITIRSFSSFDSLFEYYLILYIKRPFTRS